MTHTRLVICGYSRHGKDSCAEWLAEHHGVYYQSSSRAVRDDVYQMSEFLQRTYTNSHQAWLDRNSHRKLWFDSIELINTPDATTVATRIFEKVPVYCGMRSERELEAARKKWPDLLAMWVDASSRCWTGGDGSISADHCDFSVSNNRDKKDLHKRLERLFSVLEIG